jgi:hypothetical protein
MKKGRASGPWRGGVWIGSGMRPSGRAPIVTRSCPAPDQVRGGLLCRASLQTRRPVHLLKYGTIAKTRMVGTSPGRSARGRPWRRDKFGDEPRAADASLAASISEALTRDKLCQRKFYRGPWRPFHLLVCSKEIRLSVRFEAAEDELIITFREFIFTDERIPELNTN